jgi:hypothetical protein
MDGEGGVSIDNRILKGKGQCKKVLLRQWTCDDGVRVFVDQSARQGMYDDGIGIGVGISVGIGIGVEAKGIYYYDVQSAFARTSRKDASNAIDVD